MKIGFNKNNFLNFISKSKTKGGIIFLIAVVFFSWIQFSSSLPDPDSFYHIKMALLMKDQGVITNFPWLQATFFKENFTDQHFLYHLLLIPFVGFINPLMGAKISQVFFASLAILLIYWLLEKSKIRGAFFYTLLLFTAIPFLSRISLVKVPALSLIILVLVIYFIFKKNFLWLFALAFLYVWTYGAWPIVLIATFFFLVAEAFFDFILNKEKRKPLFYYFLYSFFRNLSRKENLKLSFGVLGGTAAGLIINPYFPGNLYFYWVQEFKIAFLNLQSKIGVGAEWYPSYSFTIFPLIFLVLFLWVFSISWFFMQIKKQDKKSLTLIFLSVLFFFFTLKSNRYIEYFAPLALLAASFSLNSFWETVSWRDYLQQLKKLFTPPNGFLSLFIFFWIILFSFITAQNVFNKVIELKKSFKDSVSFAYLQKSANYLKENTPKNSIVFNSSWDEFPALFYHNDHNYYINGLDQTYMYLYNEDLCKQWEKITNGELKDETLAKAVKNDFQASYILTTKRDFTEKMRENLKNEEYFKNIYEDDEAIIYKINI